MTDLVFSESYRCNTLAKITPKINSHLMGTTNKNSKFSAIVETETKFHHQFHFTSNGNSKFIKSPASGDLIYNNLKSNKTTYKSYNNIMMKRKLIQINFRCFTFGAVRNYFLQTIFEVIAQMLSWYRVSRSIGVTRASGGSPLHI